LYGLKQGASLVFVPPTFAENWQKEWNCCLGLKALLSFHLGFKGETSRMVSAARNLFQENDQMDQGGHVILLSRHSYQSPYPSRNCLGSWRLSIMSRDRDIDEAIRFGSLRLHSHVLLSIKQKVGKLQPH
jgi:hypothetical protein